MTDGSLQAEKAALRQLVTLAQARRLKLQTERQALAQREHALDQALQRQAQDEALLAQQHAQWTERWRQWAYTGGALRGVLALRQDRVLLQDLDAMVSGQRALLQARLRQLVDELAAWARRWREAQALDDALLARGRALRQLQERSADRQRDEEALASWPQAATRLRDNGTAVPR